MLMINSCHVTTCFSPACLASSHSSTQAVGLAHALLRDAFLGQHMGCQGDPVAESRFCTHAVPEQDAPYLLEPLGASFAAEAVPVRLALLAAAGKLFFARPPECQRLLGAVLAAGAADPNQDVHDRALLYYRCCTSFLSCRLFAACNRNRVWLFCCCISSLYRVASSMARFSALLLQLCGGASA